MISLATSAISSRAVHPRVGLRLYRSLTSPGNTTGERHEVQADTPVTQPESRPRETRVRPGAIVRDIVLIVVVALVISFVLKTFVVRPFSIPSASMNNTLQAGDRVLVSVLTPEVTPLKRGDVVVFEDPGGWLEPPAPATGSFDVGSVLAFLGLAAPNDNTHLVKRIIGMPGDTVACCSASGEVTVNGTPIAEPYVVIPPGKTSAARYAFSVTVPKGSLWVMGDNRYDSADSEYRYHGHLANYFVPITAVVGRAVVITWPVGRWAYLDDFPSTFATVGRPQPTIVPQG